MTQPFALRQLPNGGFTDKLYPDPRRDRAVRRRYVERMPLAAICEELSVTRDTLHRWFSLYEQEVADGAVVVVANCERTR